MIIRKSQLILRCFAQMDKDSSWFAMCVDLNLYARAGSLPEVQQQLDEIISEFVTEALTDDRDHAADLLSRRTPLAVRALGAQFPFRHAQADGRKANPGNRQRPDRYADQRAGPGAGGLATRPGK